MIQPTVGRVVWYYERKPVEGKQPLAAIVAYVHNARMVNLSVIDANGGQTAATSVPLLQDDDTPLDYPHCAWMPYQKCQAAKAEQLEAVNEAAKRGRNS